MAVKKQNISAKNTVKRIYEANDCLSILKFISKLGGFGFRLEYNIQNKKLVFQCVPVSDRSSTVIFGDKFNNISETDIFVLRYIIAKSSDKINVFEDFSTAFMKFCLFRLLFSTEKDRPEGRPPES